MTATTIPHTLRLWPLGVSIVLGLILGLWLGASNLPPCAFEDGPGPCYWDAETRGNGLGHSVVVLGDDVYVVLP